MIHGLIQKIPFIIPILAIANVGMIKIAKISATFPLKNQLNQLVQLQFNSKMPFYFNYWIIYIAIAIIISIVFLCTKKFTPYKTAMIVALNIIASVLVIYNIITKM